MTRAYQHGIQAVWAGELTRESVFDALWERHTYGTTGARIYIDFRVNGSKMGSEIYYDGKDPVAAFTVHGTDTIERVELWKYSGSAGYEMISYKGDGRYSLEDIFVDSAYSENSFYFLHVIQSDGHLAWAGPVWVDK